MFSKPLNGRSKGFVIAAAAAAVVVMTVFAPARTSASNPQSVDVVNTPNVNVVNTPAVTVASMPPVSISGTPNVNANVQFPANQAVTLIPGTATHMGRLPSQHVQLQYVPACPTTLAQFSPSDGSLICFDVANYPGQILMITDFSWSSYSGSPGFTCTMFLSINNNILYDTGAVTGPDGYTRQDQHWTTGFKATVTPQVAPQACKTVRSAYLQGYLTANQ